MNPQLPGRAIYWHKTIDSTMVEAARLAAGGCPSGTVVGADEQTAGQGRHGRKWHSERGAGLYVSIVLRIPVATELLPVVTLALGLAVSEAVASTSGVLCDLRWPNDVLTGRKKCAGILVQLHDTAVIAGIGINVNQTSFPPDVAALATSLRIASGREHSRELLLNELVAAVDRYVDLFAAEGREPILKMFCRASSYAAGRRVSVDQADGVLEGTTEGLDSNGFLMVRLENGKRVVVLAGGVRPVE